MILKLAEHLQGAHVRVTVYVGPDTDHLAHAGQLVFRLDEWPTLAAVLENGCPGVVLRGPCPACGHTGHVGDMCLAAMAEGDVEVFCPCALGAERLADALFADALDPFTVHTAEALAIVEPRPAQRDTR